MWCFEVFISIVEVAFFITNGTIIWYNQTDYVCLHQKFTLMQLFAYATSWYYIEHWQVLATVPCCITYFHLCRFSKATTSLWSIYEFMSGRCITACKYAECLFVDSFEVELISRIEVLMSFKHFHSSHNARARCLSSMSHRCDVAFRCVVSI